ncbi:hypothetical protein BDV28DRAFT_18550 [Aspergillus coremiiformis]|uniref:Xylanolytic transcriptional activator regulatory domain-containing protein n=1 Tax=Aspergillus coremiiformis TaxID=138285 RepID=A0A5N6Z1F9_9EURO|nr:hypothetical protein BDV28DRAFT_18550 [Aspergillus coremiiformis]
MFDDYFIRKVGSDSNLLQMSIASFQRSRRRFSTDTALSHPTHHYLNHDGLLSSIAQEMVETLLMRLGSLKCGQSDETKRNFFIASLAADTTLSMFGPSQHQNPLANFGQHRILQLIDLWFSVHPLSPLVSKTLLISDIKDGTVDEALLAIILADACHTQGNSSEQNGNINDDSQILAAFASTQLKQRQLPLTDATALSTVQALFLMGWRELCLGRARRATCIVAYTCYTASRLTQTWKKDVDKASVKLNGVEIGMVKNEILQNLHWMCLSTTTWAFMQFDQALALFGPNETFPCLDETTSALIRLDQASDNISTLPAQIQALRCLWPLSHISSTVAHIYIMYLNSPTMTTPKASWQEQHIHQLYDLLQSCVEFPTLSLKIRDVLLQAVQVVEHRITALPSQLYLLTAYHIIIIHMMFSRTKVSQESLNLSSAVIQAFCQSASALLALSQRSLTPSRGLMPAQREEGMEVMEMLVLGLDTCSRALVHIYDHLSRGSIDNPKTMTVMKGQLADYADKFHQVCKGDAVLRCGSVVRPIKKRLKWAKLAFQQLQSSFELQPVHFSAQGLSEPAFAIAQPGDLPLSNLVPCDALQQSALEVTDPFIFVDDPVIGSLLGFPEFTNAYGHLSQDFTYLQENKQIRDAERGLSHIQSPTPLLLDNTFSGESLDLVLDGYSHPSLFPPNTNDRPDELHSTPSDMAESMCADAAGFTPPNPTFDEDLWTQLFSNPDDNTGPFYDS